MTSRGRKPEKLVMAWDILRRKAEIAPSIGVKQVDYPLKVLESSGIAAPGRILTKLEKAKYIEKHTNGTRELVWIKMLKMTDLGEDVLGSKPPRPELSRGNQISGQEPPAPATQVTVETDGVKDNVSGDVVIVCDYENLRYSLEEYGAVLDFHELIKRARQYGGVVRSMAFVPVHTSADIQTELRISGFRIEVCPPRKLHGGDTCDQAIEEFVRFCLKYTRIGTFVLVSGDGDFIDIVDEIENSGRKWVLFHYNHRGTSKVLLSRAGDAVNLASFARPKEGIVECVSSAELKREEKANELVDKSNNSVLARRDHEYTYIKLIEGLSDCTTTLDKSDVLSSFLKAIISCLAGMRFVGEEPMHRKSFPELKEAVWQEVYGEFQPSGLTKDIECHGALSALRKLKIITTNEQDIAPHTYYVFNQNHPLVADILAPLAASYNGGNHETT